MREPTFLILTALAGHVLHGYALMQEIKRLSDGRVVLKTGSLYGALDRLAAEGLIEVEREEAVDGRLRRYYRLSQSGARALRDEVERLRHNASLADARLRTEQRARKPSLGTA